MMDVSDDDGELAAILAALGGGAAVMAGVAGRTDGTMFYILLSTGGLMVVGAIALLYDHQTT